MKNIWILLLLPLVANSDTTGNLITNGTFDNGTTGWTLTDEAQRIGDCCPGGHDLEFGVSGSIEQTFDLTSDDITTQMLDNGITLNSTVEVQNGEGGVGSWCPSCGGADSFRIDLTILDNNSQVLSTTTQTRTDVTGINGVDFTDSVTYTGTGSYYGNIFIKGEDASTGTLGGPNVDNISVTMTYDPTVLSLEQTQHISSVAEVVEEIYIEEFVYEEPIIEEVVFEEPTVEIVEEPIPIEEKEFIEETIVFKPEEETIVAEEEVIYETVGEAETSLGNGGSESNEVNVEESETNESTPETIEEGGGEESPRVNTRSITVEDVEKRINRATNNVNQRLVGISLLLVNVMKSDISIDNYGQINNNIFKDQPDIDGGNYEDAQYYADARDIYSESQISYNDPAAEYEQDVQTAVDNRIRAEEHLRRIRGY